MGIFSQGWKSQDKEKALKWVLKQTGTEIGLLRAAKFAADAEVRRMAVEKMTDQRLLVEVVKAYKYSDDETGLLAGQRITDQNQLKSLAQDHNKWAVKSLRDQNILLSIATDPTFDTGHFNIDALEEPADTRRKLAQIAVERIIELGKVDLLEQIAKESRYDEAALRAAQALMDSFPERVLTIPTDTSFNPSVRVAATEYISDEETLSEIADFYIEANRNLDPQNIVGRISNDRVTRTAIQRIKDPEKRKKYCPIYKNETWVHQWEWIDKETDGRFSSVIGSTIYYPHYFRCVLCGTQTERDYPRFYPVQELMEDGKLPD